MSIKDTVGPRGHVVAELFGSDGKLRQREETHNLVTDVGDQAIAAQCFVGAGAPTMKNMKLATGTTAVAKNGAGSFIATGTYISGSAHVCDESSPKVGAAANVVTFIHTWAANEAPGTVRRASIVNNTTDAYDDAAHTMAMALFGADIVVTATDTLKITWNITLLGA